MKLPETPPNMIHDHERKIIRLETKVEIMEVDQQRLKDELAVYQAAVIGQNKKQDAILHALVGDETMKSKGLVQRVESIEIVADWIKEIKWKFIGGMVVAGAVAAAFLWLLEKLFK